MQQLAEDYVHLYTAVGAGNLLQEGRKQKIELKRALPVALVALQAGRIANACSRSASLNFLDNPAFVRL